MIKKLFAIALALSISSWAMAPSVSAALTDSQVQSILDLLESFGADSTTIDNVESALTGGAVTPTTPTVSGCSITSFDRALSVGMTGDDVKCLQIVLNSDSVTKIADSGVGSPGNETSYFGPLTKAGVVKFQEKYSEDILASWGLTQGTGYVGQTTRAKLNELLGSGIVDDDDDDDDDVVITGDFTVALSADTPAASTIVADTTANDGGQALIPALTLTFSNGNASDIDVTSLKVKRSGISADADISQAYLYDEDGNQLAQYGAFSSGVITFTKSSGLFTVKGGKTKKVTFKFDLTNGTGSGKTFKFSVLSADYIGSEASSVGGSFPIDSNFLTTATTADLGKLAVATTTAPSTTVDPQDNFDLFPFTLAASDQKLEIRRIKFTNMGSVNDSDLQNLKLYDGATQILETIDQPTDGVLIFDFGDDPLIIDAGITKNLYLKGDITGGTNRTFQWSIQEQTDIEAYDTEYSVFIKPDASGWFVQKYAATTINTGKLSLSRASDSLSGSVAKDATNVSLSKFDIKAIGEDVKITQGTFDFYGSINSKGLDQVKIYFDGSQKGSTADSGSGAAAGTADLTVSFGNTFIVPADGEFHLLEIKSDVKASSSAAFTGGETLTAAVLTVTAAGKTSLASVGSVAAAGHTLTVRAGTLSVSKNNAYANWSGTIPTGVAGEADAMIGAWIITGGSGEGSSITAVKVKDDGSKGFGNYQNLSMYYGGTKDGGGVKIGDTQSSLSTNTTYTFYPSPYIDIDAAEQIELYAYADIKTTTTTGAGASLKIDEVDGTGKTTNSSVNFTNDISGQTHFVATAGALSFVLGADTPSSANLVGGGGPYTFATFDITAGAAENVDMTKVIMEANMSASAPQSSINNLSLWDGSSQVGSLVSGINASSCAIFDLTASPWTIPAGTEKTLTVKGYVPVVDSVNAVSGGGIQLRATSLDANIAFTYQGAKSGVSATSSLVLTGNAMYTYKTVLTADESSYSPTTKTGAGKANDQILVFKVTNEGAYTGYLVGVTTTMEWTQGTGVATATAVRLLEIYEYGDYDLGEAELASTTIASGTAYSAGTHQFVFRSYGKGTGAVSIPAGTTKYFEVRMDTTDVGQSTAANVGTSLRLSIASALHFTWDDDTSTTTQVRVSRNRTFPVEGNVLSW